MSYHWWLNSFLLLKRSRCLSYLCKLMRGSVVVPFQKSHFPAPKRPQQLQRSLDDHPKFTIAVALINNVNQPNRIGLHNDSLKLHLHGQSNSFIHYKGFRDSCPIIPIQHHASCSYNHPPTISNKYMVNMWIFALK